MSGPQTWSTSVRDDQLNARFERARRVVMSTRLLDFDCDRLEAMEQRLSDSQAAATASMEELETELQEAIAASNWPRIEALRARAVEQTRLFEDMRETAERVRDARLERHLQDAIATRLGGTKRRVVYEAAIMMLIFMVVGVLLVQEFGNLNDATMEFLDWVDFGACCFFLTDFFWRMRLSRANRWFWRRYWLDFVTSIPLPSMQTLRLGRTVRLVRLLRLLRLLRVIRLALFFWRGMDKLAAAFDVKLMRRSLWILAGVLSLGGLGILYTEADTHASEVSTFGQSLWWSFTTVVTGGFGDIYNPESIGGRMLTVGLVIAGMVVVGIFTATLTSLLVRENDESEAILSLEERVLRELTELRADLDRRLPPAPELPTSDEP